jgi:hypothetical protein
VGAGLATRARGMAAGASNALAEAASPARARTFILSLRGALLSVAFGRSWWHGFAALVLLLAAAAGV